MVDEPVARVSVPLPHSRGVYSDARGVNAFLHSRHFPSAWAAVQHANQQLLFLPNSFFSRFYFAALVPQTFQKRGAARTETRSSARVVDLRATVAESASAQLRECTNPVNRTPVCAFPISVMARFPNPESLTSVLHNTAEEAHSWKCTDESTRSVFKFTLLFKVIEEVLNIRISIVSSDAKRCCGGSGG